MLLLPLLLHSQPLPSQPPTLFPTTFPIRYTLCWQFVLHFFRDREKKKIRFWKLFGIKVSFLKSFSYVSFIYTGSGSAEIIHNRKIKTICILNGRKKILLLFCLETCLIYCISERTSSIKIVTRNLFSINQKGISFDNRASIGLNIVVQI